MKFTILFAALIIGEAIAFHRTGVVGGQWVDDSTLTGIGYALLILAVFDFVGFCIKD